MPNELIQDREGSAHLAYLYELEGLRLLDETSVLEFDRRQAQANFREALNQWGAVFGEERSSELAASHTPLHRKMISFGLSEVFSGGTVPIAFRLRACSILAGLNPPPTAPAAAIRAANKPGDLLLRACLAIHDRREVSRLMSLFAASCKTILEVHRNREGELRFLESLGALITFAAREEFDSRPDLSRLRDGAREACCNHPEAEFLLHLCLMVSHSCQPSHGMQRSDESGQGSVLSFRPRPTL